MQIKIRRAIRFPNKVLVKPGQEKTLAKILKAMDPKERASTVKRLSDTKSVIEVPDEEDEVEEVVEEEE